MTFVPTATASSDADLVPTFATTPAPRHPNDNSNPQQGTGMLPESSPLGSIGPSVSSETTRTYSTKIPPTHKDARKLFVGGLPADVTEQEFREFFSQFGTVMDSVVMFDRETHRSRGFGFVTFDDPTVSHRLLEMNDSGAGVARLVMRGKTCEVKAAQPKEGSMRGATRYGRNSNYGGRSRANTGAAHVQTKPFVPHHSTPQATSFQPPTDPNSTMQAHIANSVPYIQDPNMNTSIMYATGNYGQYGSGSLYYASYVAPMYYTSTAQATGAAYDPASYLNGSHVSHPEAIHSRGLSHQPPVPQQHHHVSQQQPITYFPYNVPIAYAGYPSSVMQPLAPGLPTRPDDNLASDGTPENGQHHCE